jgi:hypothetical protein
MTGERGARVLDRLPTWLWVVAAGFAVGALLALS